MGPGCVSGNPKCVSPRALLEAADRDALMRCERSGCVAAPPGVVRWEGALGVVCAWRRRSLWRSSRMPQLSTRPVCVCVCVCACVSVKVRVCAHCLQLRPRHGRGASACCESLWGEAPLGALQHHSPEALQRCAVPVHQACPLYPCLCSKSLRRASLHGPPPASVKIVKGPASAGDLKGNGSALESTEVRGMEGAADANCALNCMPCTLIKGTRSVPKGSLDAGARTRAHTGLTQGMATQRRPSVVVCARTCTRTHTRIHLRTHVALETSATLTLLFVRVCSVMGAPGWGKQSEPADPHGPCCVRSARSLLCEIHMVLVV